jgi:putative transposase
MGDVGAIEEGEEVRRFRTYKVLLQPTARQARALECLLGAQSEIYNAALEERRAAWRRGVSVRLYDQFAQLSDIRQSRPEVMAFGTVVARGTLFRRVRAGEKPGYPRFRSRRRFDTASYEDPGSGWAYKEGGRRLYVQGVGHLKVKAHRRITGVPKTCHLRREGRRYFVLIQCAQVPAEPVSPTGRDVGLDLGVSTLVTCSDGTAYPNARHTGSASEELGAAQAVLASKRPGSRRRRGAVAALARVHRRIANRRRDDLHKVSRSIVNRYDTIVTEDLRITNMTRTAKGTLETPGTRVAQKAGLNKEICSAGWGTLIAMIAYKAEGAGRRLIVVDPRHTSQRCSHCGHTEAANRTTQAAVVCRRCGFRAHADHNAAINILRAGLA